MKHSNEEIQRAKEISIQSILSKLGINIVRPGRKYDFAYSPWRAEKVPSFVIYKPLNYWKDLGDVTQKKFDDVIALVMKMENLNFNEAIKFLLNDGQNFRKFKYEEKEKSDGIIIKKIKILESKTLISYLCSRNIDVDLARLYCKEVHINFAHGRRKDVLHKYIGFENIKGGFELRNQYKPLKDGFNIGKISNSPKFFSVIDSGLGDNIVFEGFFDFLSALQFFGVEKFDETVVVLNSLSFVGSCLDRLKKGNNYMFLDNDDAADKALEILHEEGVTFTDERKLYKGYKDFNEYLINETERQRKAIKRRIYLERRREPRVRA